MSTANAFGWRSVLSDPPPPEMYDLPLQFHQDGGAVFVVTLRELVPTLDGACSLRFLWWRPTGIARELCAEDAA